MFIVWVCWVAEKKNVDLKKLCKNRRKVRKITSSYSSSWKNINRIQWTRTSCKLLIGFTSTVFWPWGTLDYKAIVESMANVENTRSRGSYTKFTDVDRFQIGRYAGENGNKKALIHFKNKFSGLKESTVRTFKKQP